MKKSIFGGCFAFCFLFASCSGSGQKIIIWDGGAIIALIIFLIDTNHENPEDNYQFVFYKDCSEILIFGHLNVLKFKSDLNTLTLIRDELTKLIDDKNLKNSVTEVVNKFSEDFKNLLKPNK